MKQEFEFEIGNLDCANCANKIEAGLNKQDYITSAQVNFMLKKVMITTKEAMEEEHLRAKVERLADSIEQGVKIYISSRQSHHHGHGHECQCGEHSHQHAAEEKMVQDKFEFSIGNLDCAGCGNKIEAALNKEAFIKNAQLNFMMKKLIVTTVEDMDKEELRVAMEKIADSIEEGVKLYSEGELDGQCTGSCQCGTHDHDHKELGVKHRKVTEERKDQYSNWLLVIGLVIFGIGAFSHTNILLVAAYICIGYDIVWKAFKDVLRGKMMDENFLMTLATLAAFAIGQFPEAVAVMAFYKIGEYMQKRAVGYSKKEIAKAMDIRPDFARVIRQGKDQVVKPNEVKVGEIIEVRAGEKLPLDGVIVEGSTMLDTSMLTGESMPQSVKSGNEVLSGSINKEGIIRVKVTTDFKDSTVSKILELIENATSKKSKSENFITKFARWYTPIVVGLAVFIAIVPSLITGNFSEWIYSGITFLVISCPCAVVVSVPLGFFAGLGEAAHRGVLVKGSNYLEELNSIDTIILDKTGTITKGQFGITEVVEGAGKKQDILRLAAALEKGSNHPIARSIVDAYRGEPLQEAMEVKEISGEGMAAVIDGQTVLAGNEKLMKRYHIAVPDIKALGSYVYVAQNDVFLGCIIVADQIKEDSKEAIAKLKAAGIRKVIMLTGDKKEIAEKVGQEVGVDEVYAELLPQHKVEKLEEALQAGKAAFVGDGINDAPVLARANIGIAMGGVGSDAAIEAADIVLMTDELSSIGEVLKVSKRTRRIVTENIVFALGVKVIVMLLSVMGMANMWLAIFADVGVSLLAVINSIRVLNSTDVVKKMMKRS